MTWRTNATGMALALACCAVRASIATRSSAAATGDAGAAKQHAIARNIATIPSRAGPDISRPGFVKRCGPGGNRAGKSLTCPTAPTGGRLPNRQTLSIYAPFAIELALPFRPYSMIQKSEYRFPDMIVLHVKSWSMTAPKGLSQEHAKSGLDRANGSHGHERMMRFKMEAFNGYRYR